MKSFDIKSTNEGTNTIYVAGAHKAEPIEYDYNGLNNLQTSPTLALIENIPYNNAGF